MRVPYLVAPPVIPRHRLTFDSFDNEAQFIQMFGFSIDDAYDVHDAMGVPDEIMLNEGRHSFAVSGQHCFLYLLYRMYSPSQRQTLDSAVFGYDYSVLSKMFNAMCNWVDATHGHRLRQMQHIVPRFPQFNEVIRNKLEQNFNLQPGVPAHAQQCALFVDGTRFKCSRPSGPWWIQYAAFSGDKWIHNHGAQGIFAPDGMFYHWYDGPVGRHNDKHFFRESGVNAVLRDAQLGHAVQYVAYGDKGYSEYTHLRVAYHGPGPVTAHQKFENWLMAKERIGVEWGYGKLKRRCPFVSKSHLLKLRGSDVAKYVRVAVLLTNAHTCLRQSQTGLYFDCPAPALNEYFN